MRHWGTPISAPKYIEIEFSENKTINPHQPFQMQIHGVELSPQIVFNDHVYRVYQGQMTTTDSPHHLPHPPASRRGGAGSRVRVAGGL